MMQREAAQGQVGAALAEGQVARIGLDKENALMRRRGLAGKPQGVELAVDRDHGQLAVASARVGDEVAALVAVARAEVDDGQPLRRAGQEAEHPLHRGATAEGAVEPAQILQVDAQLVLVLARKVHDLRLVL